MEKNAIYFTLVTFLFFILPFSLFFSSCKTDLEVNAPYNETTIVYALLNQKDSIHYFKINKTFLGSANAYDMAAVRDSSEYNTAYSPRMTAIIEEWKNGTIQKQPVILEDTVINNKESGTFYSPDQIVYYFINPNLDPAAQYRLNISLNGGERIVSAKTELINNLADFTGGQQFSIYCKDNPGVHCIGFSATRGKYADKEFTWRSVKDGKRYQLEMGIYYVDFLVNGTSDTNKINWTFQPPLIANNLEGGEDMSVLIAGEDFYKELKRQLTPLTDAAIVRRSFDKMELRLFIAGDDLNTYLLANEPSTGIIQEKPEFTNIENGVGIFSARLSVTSPQKLLDVYSLDELVGGQYTYDLKFCRLNTANGQLICD